MRKRIEKKETDQQIEILKPILKTGNRSKKMRKTLKKKTGNESNVNIAEMDQKQSDFPFCSI